MATARGLVAAHTGTTLRLRHRKITRPVSSAITHWHFGASLNIQNGLTWHAKIMSEVVAVGEFYRCLYMKLRSLRGTLLTVCIRSCVFCVVPRGRATSPWPCYL
eukprot:5889519-Pleurochrysis_carterae.AAC.1